MINFNEIDNDIDSDDDVDSSKESQSALDGNQQSGQEEDDYSLDDNATILFEDDDFYLTDKGAVPKTSVKDNSSAEPSNDGKLLGKFNSVDDLVKSYTELEKKLGNNSEAVAKLREVEPVLPLLEALINDENFLDMAERYFNDPIAQREALMKSLGIEEGYQFDLDEALSNPSSKDAKILQKLQKGQTKKSAPQQQNSTLSPEAKAEFMTKYNMDESSFNSFIDQSKTKKLTLDDVYLILNKDEIIKKAKEDATKEALANVRAQRSNAMSVGKSKSSKGGSNVKSAEDTFIDALIGSSIGLFSS